MTQRVKCTECDNMILPQTAADNQGLCGQCVRISPEMRAESREFERRLSAGLLFKPDQAELATASEINLSAKQWSLQPEYYADVSFSKPMDAIAAELTEDAGNVFLVAEDGAQLNLGFTSLYAVCEYQHLDAGEFRYAYTPSNCHEQVAGEHHVVQACPCCGVGMLWYPSRFHMPRDAGFSLLENAVKDRESGSVVWLESDDFSHTGRGYG